MVREFGVNQIFGGKDPKGIEGLPFGGRKIVDAV
jgi:hypothetical protein